VDVDSSRLEKPRNVLVALLLLKTQPTVCQIQFVHEKFEMAQQLRGGLPRLLAGEDHGLQLLIRADLVATFCDELAVVLILRLLPRPLRKQPQDGHNMLRLWREFSNSTARKDSPTPKEE